MLILNVAVARASLFMVAGALGLPAAASNIAIRREMETVFGEAPASCRETVPSTPQLLAKRETPGGRIERYQSRNCAGAFEFTLGIPQDVTPKTAVVVALPQTGSAGTKEVFGIEGDPALAVGMRFMQAGFVVISPEVWINGNGPDASPDWSTDRFYKLFPNWSAVGRMLLDNRSVIDVLPALGRAPSCIAAVGHSLGGHNALFLSAFDERIDVTVSSGGFEPIATDTDAERWSRTSWFIYMPALRSTVIQPAPRKTPFDFDSILTLIFPRAVQIVQGKDDPVWTNETLIPDYLKAVAGAYARAKISANFSLSMFDGGHEFPSTQQSQAVEFIQERCAHLTR